MPPATNGMNDKTFIDSNILIYAHDADAESKHEIAQRILMELWEKGSGVLSMQVLQEFYVNVTRKIASPLPRKVARSVISSYAIWCGETTPTEISSAFQIEDESRIGFWDAMIVAAALKSGARRILSEDLNAGQMLAGVRIENPFIESRSRAQS
jgi:predicted nucleic acid-binding protein